MGEIGDHMEPISDADWSGEWLMDQGDPAAPWDMDVSERTMRYDDFSHLAFTKKLHRQILPNDSEHREGFDVPTTFRLGDQNVHFHAAAAKSYETSGDIGKPEWDSLFGYILSKMNHLRFVSTAYVLVDNRGLTNLDNPDPSLQHWPAVAAWWSSRVRMMGPAQERCDVVFMPICQVSGLHKVHPTWAGTFVLAALSLVFPMLRIVLLDSDCVPVTLLFEVEDLWQEAQRLQPHGPPCEATTSSCAGGMNVDSPGQAHGPPFPIEQGVILVTEHNAELNAGFVVLLGSNHVPLSSEEDWQNIPLGQGDKQEQAIATYQQVLSAYWQLVSQMTSHGRDDRDMTPEECRAWI